MVLLTDLLDRRLELGKRCGGASRVQLRANCLDLVLEVVVGAGHLFHVLFGGQVLMVLGIQGGLDGRQLALGRTLLDALELGEKDRVAR